LSQSLTASWSYGVIQPTTVVTFTGLFVTRLPVVLSCHTTVDNVITFKGFCVTRFPVEWSGNPTVDRSRHFD